MAKVGFISLGCPKNLVDSELMLGQLVEQGYTLTPAEREAEVIVVNTCSFIGPAREEAIDTILEAARWKKEGACRWLVVTGCLVQQHRDELARALPEVDAFLGVSEFHRLGEALAALPQGQRPLLVGPPTRPYPEHAPRCLATPPWTAYLKIAEGCDGVCTFCTIPQIRGPFRSRPPEAVLAEAERLAHQGVKELILVAEDTTQYGHDLAGRRLLPELLRDLASIAGVRWLRLLYAYPTRVDDRLIDVLATEPKVCAYLDLPLQHGDNAILKAMGRAGRRESYLRLIARLRERIPDLALRSTFIVGFPGETRARFEALGDFLLQAQLDRVGFFLYSPEPGTPAAARPGRVSERTAARRLEELSQLQADISTRRNERFVGRTLTVLLETWSPEEKAWRGRSYRDAPDIDGCVYVQADPALQPGHFVEVRITRAGVHDLWGARAGQSGEEADGGGNPGANTSRAKFPPTSLVGMTGSTTG